MNSRREYGSRGSSKSTLNGPVRSRRGAVGRTAARGQIVHVPDVLADPEYDFVQGIKLGGYRSSLGVPLLREGVPIGVFVLARPVVRPFTDKQIALVIDLRRPSGDRDRERAAVRRGAGAYARTHAVGRGVAATGDVLKVSALDARPSDRSRHHHRKATQLSATDVGAIYVFDEANRRFEVPLPTE